MKVLAEHRRLEVLQAEWQNHTHTQAQGQNIIICQYLSLKPSPSDEHKKKKRCMWSFFNCFFPVCLKNCGGEGLVRLLGDKNISSLKVRKLSGPVAERRRSAHIKEGNRKWTVSKSPWSPLSTLTLSYGLCSSVWSCSESTHLLDSFKKANVLNRSQEKNRPHKKTYKYKGNGSDEA